MEPRQQHFPKSVSVRLKIEVGLRTTGPQTAQSLWAFPGYFHMRTPQPQGQGLSTLLGKRGVLPGQPAPEGCPGEVVCKPARGHLGELREPRNGLERGSPLNSSLGWVRSFRSRASLALSWGSTGPQRQTPRGESTDYVPGKAVSAFKWH